jgi:hypothetical protein
VVIEADNTIHREEIEAANDHADSQNDDGYGVLEP